MKRFIIGLFLCLGLGFSAFAQDESSSSKTLAFLAKDGSFIIKEFYQLGAVNKIDCEVLILTNALTKEKMGCLRVKKTYYASYSSSPDTYIGTLDYDELEACIKSINYINDTMLPSSPEVYTECEYKTRDDVKVGAYYSTEKTKWTAYMYTKGGRSHSSAFFDASNLSELASVMSKAKEIIAEKVK